MNLIHTNLSEQKGISEGGGTVFLFDGLRIAHIIGGCVHTVYSKRNAHLIPNFFMAPLGEGGQKFTWSIM